MNGNLFYFDDVISFSIKIWSHIALLPQKSHMIALVTIGAEQAIIDVGISISDSISYL